MQPRSGSGKRPAMRLPGNFFCPYVIPDGGDNKK
jgi:hypothetical protein